jgi:hypothetical protein
MIAVVAGALANKAFNGGNAWARLSWTRGLDRLGVETYFVEQLDPAAPSGGVAFFDAVMHRFGEPSRSALIGAGGEVLAGELDRDRLLDVAGEADLLINLSGHLQLADVRQRIGRSVYIDDDPGYTQLWHASGAIGDRLDGHDAYYTFGTRIGARTCTIPTSGIDWRPILPPVVLEDWPVASHDGAGRVTTVASWRGPFGRLEHDGVRYGQKAHELRKVSGLPALAGRPLEIALQIDPVERREAERLQADGWAVVDPSVVASDPASFRAYVQGSAAEFSVAQGIYVETGSGWFSDRTTRYLASGKPAVVQDTGFSDDLDGGEGLIPFTTLADAAAGLRSLERSYDDHARAARALAAERFASDVVLGRLLEEVL